MHHLPDINCIYSVKNCKPEEVDFILNEIKVSSHQVLSEMLQNLENYILAQEQEKISNNALDCFENAIGEIVSCHKGAKWKELNVKSSGLDGYGLLLSDGTVVVPKIMLEDLMQTQKPGTLAFYLIGVN